MPAKSEALRTAIIDLVFNGDVPAWALIATEADLILALHTAALAADDTQDVSECDYTGYLAMAVARGAGWTRATDTAGNAALVSFPAATDPADDQWASHVSAGFPDGGSGRTVLYQAELEAELGATETDGATPADAVQIVVDSTVDMVPGKTLHIHQIGGDINRVIFNVDSATLVTVTAAVGVIVPNNTSITWMVPSPLRVVKGIAPTLQIGALTWQEL